MRIKRVLQGTALTALAAAAWIGAGSADASASTINGMDINVDTAAQEMTVTTSDAEVLFGVGTVNKSSKVKVAAWDVHEANGQKVTIDLSKLNNVKDNYIAVKTEKDNPVYIKIAASLKGQTAVYNAEQNTIAVTPKSNATNPSGQWQYRTSYGNWQTLDTAKKDLFKDYQYQGASLYIRATAATVSAIKSTDAKLTDATDATKEYSVYEAGSLPGKESKLNIAKQANAPKVAVNYLKNEVTLKKGTEYRVLTVDDSGKYTIPAATTTVDANSTEKLSDLLKSASSGVIEVRTVAKAANSNGKGSKAPSKWARVDLKKTATIATTNATITTGSATTVSTGIKIQATVKKNAINGIKITSSTGSAINVKIGTKVKTLKASTGSDVTGTLAAKAGDTIEIAIAGDKKAKVFAGEYVVAGKVAE